jgi:DNA repair protein SbcC/Rad50
MRPLRLLLDGFGTYRQPASADFCDVDFFALVGPTGSGKSTLIDGLCFALYGTVPRWGRENAIAQALAPSASACRVCLVFEAAGRRYAAVRALSRDARGQVHTKEARLERLDSSVAPDAPIEEIMQASVEQLAEGPDQVKAQVQELLGLSYEHFTQSVLLPQGRFSEFLHAKSSDRQDLLVELLAFGVYERIGQRAREHAKITAEKTQHSLRARRELAAATKDAEALAAARLAALTTAAALADDMLAGLAGLRQQADLAVQQAGANRAESALLSALRMPAEVPDLAQRIAEADSLVTRHGQQRDQAQQLEQEAGRARAELPDRTLMERTVAAHAERRRLATLHDRQETARAARQDAERPLAKKLHDAERNLQLAQAQLADAERAAAAAHLAEGLNVGDDCPVCLRAVTALPHHAAPADLLKARKAVEHAVAGRQRAQAAHTQAAKDTAAATGVAEQTGRQLTEITDALSEATAEVDAIPALEAIVEADQALDKARKNAAACRAQVSAAEKERSSLAGAEQQARAVLARSRDKLVALGAPAVDETDLAGAWSLLATWAGAQAAERSKAQGELDAAARDLRERIGTQSAEIAGLLAGHGISGVADPARAPAVLAEHRARAQSQLDAVRADRRKAAKLDQQIAAQREDEQVASKLGLLLRSDSFERWLCSEALDSLVTEASATLMELSGGQYQLDRDERNELVVIDYEDAGARRPVHTLSGGETFQASLALALALSRQVVGLSAGLRDLNSMFLDEGFGTLDEDSLETVAATLERLAANSDRMVGIVTHVAALADRVPVRFVVARSGTGSTLRKEGGK